MIGMKNVEHLFWPKHYKRSLGEDFIVVKYNY